MLSNTVPMGNRVTAQLNLLPEEPFQSVGDAQRMSQVTLKSHGF